MRPEHEESFRRFAEAAMPRLRRLAWASCRDGHRADDLVQSTLEKLYVAWPRIERVDDPFAYARTTLVRTLVSEQRRRWWRAEHTTDDPYRDGTELPVPPQTAVIESRMVMRNALAGLPTRQRQVLVLRYMEDLSVADVADLMRCSEGTVKSTTHDAITALRCVLDSFAGQAV